MSTNAKIAIALGVGFGLAHGVQWIQRNLAAMQARQPTQTAPAQQ